MSSLKQIEANRVNTLKSGIDAPADTLPDPTNKLNPFNNLPRKMGSFRNRPPSPMRSGPWLTLWGRRFRLPFPSNKPPNHRRRLASC